MEPTNKSLPPAPVSQQDPVLALSIIGLVITFAFLPVGFIINLVALRKARPHTTARTIAITSTILSSIGMLALFFIVWTFMQTSDIRKSNEAKTQAALRSLDSAQKAIWPQVISVNDDYVFPGTLKNAQISRDLEFGTLKSKPKTPYVIEYAVCNDGRVGRFGFWNYFANQVEYRYIKMHQITEAVNCRVISS